LYEVFKSLDTLIKGGAEVPVKKDGGDAIREFFGKVLPNFDEEQVYTSDILKICNWYKVLTAHIDFQEEQKVDDEKSETSGTPKAKKSPTGKKVQTKKVSTARSAPAKAPKITQRKMS